MVAEEREQVTVDEILRHGIGVCSGYVPDTVPGRYMELWAYKGSMFAIACDMQGSKVYPLGLLWTTALGE